MVVLQDMKHPSDGVSVRVETIYDIRSWNKSWTKWSEHYKTLCIQFIVRQNVFHSIRSLVYMLDDSELRVVLLVFFPVECDHPRAQFLIILDLTHDKSEHVYGCTFAVRCHECWTGSD